MPYQSSGFPIFVYGWRWGIEFDCFNEFCGFNDCSKSGESGISANKFFTDFLVKSQYEGVYEFHIFVLAMDLGD